MKKQFSIFRLVGMILSSVVLALAFGTAVHMGYGYDTITVAAITFATPPVVYLGVRLAYSALDLTFPQVRQTTRSLCFAVQVESWVDYIQNNIWKENDFVNLSFSESDKVLSGTVVHLPQAGAKPSVVMNRSSFPAAAVRRTDADITYTLDDFSTDPTHITNAEAAEVSYDKQESIIGEHRMGMAETAADQLLYRWTTGLLTGSILRTTGAAVATSLAPGATGTRLTFLATDLKRAQALMNKQNVTKTDRYAMIPSDLYQELTADATLLGRDGANGGEINMKDGVILKLHGFNIIERSATTIFNAATPPAAKAVGASTATTDNQAVICWQKNAVAKALGTVEFFENRQDALYYGDIYSARIKFGGRRRRSDDTGVVVIVQA